MPQFDRAPLLKAFLEEACERLDRRAKVRSWHSWHRSLAGVPAVLGLSLALGHCGGSTSEEQAHECAGDDCAQLCHDEIDNDGDGAVDCDDSDCPFGLCAEPVYGMPMPEYCDDDVDNDGDGLIDCEDDECAQFLPCTGEEYAVPFESACDDGEDNDEDNAPDCEDSDCADFCGTPVYGIVLEVDCEDGVDNDGDGEVDCSDPDCLALGPCATPEYAMPF